MKLFITLSLLLLMGFSVKAQGYAYLNLKTANGKETSIAANQVKITLHNGAFTAQCADGSSTTVALANAVSMQFSNTGTATVLKGDINQDGMVDVSDVTALVTNMLEQSSNNLEIADLNGDGSIDVSDVTSLINLILNGDAQRVAQVSRQSLWVHTGATKWAFDAEQVGVMTFANATTFTAQGKTFAIADIDSITVSDQGVDDYNVVVTYANNAAEAWVSGNIAANITSAISGANVNITQDATVAAEYIYTLSGSTANGSFSNTGSYKATLVLNGVSITNPAGAAVSINNGKRVAVVLNEGTVNTFVDGSGGTHKAALYFGGHPEFEGAGTLNVTGNTKHAISAKEYLQLKKTTGAINILGAVGDGIHCGKGNMGDVENNHFTMSGGTVTMTGVKGDGIDSDDYGCIYIKGGKVNITVDAEDVTGLKADSVFTITGGEVNVTVSGNLSQGVKASWMGNFNGGSITATVSGNGAKGISGKCFTDVATKTTLNGGYLNFGGSNVTMNVSGSNVVVGTDTTRCMGIKCDKDMTQSAGSIAITLSGTEAKAVDVEGTFTRTGGILEVKSPTQTPAVKTNGNFTMSDGELTLICTGEEANALSCDGDIAISGGSVEIRCSGAGSKGIKAEGKMTVGENGKPGPVMLVHTTGDRKTGTGSTGGGWQPPTRHGGGDKPGGGGNTSSGGSPKAIKIMGIFSIYSGTMDVSTAKDGGEGIESKNTMNFDGGEVRSYCYDDCINCTGKIYVRGAKVVCFSNGNDAVDSNANTNGSVEVSDGVLVAVSSKGGAEMGIDADGNSRITIKGGYVFTGGGNQGGSSSTIGSASQGYYWLTGKSFFRNQLLHSCRCFRQ